VFWGFFFAAVLWVLTTSSTGLLRVGGGDALVSWCFGGFFGVDSFCHREKHPKYVVKLFKNLLHPLILSPFLLDLWGGVFF